MHHEVGTGHCHYLTSRQNDLFVPVIEDDLKIVDAGGFPALLPHIRIDFIRHPKQRIRLVDQMDTNVIQNVDPLAADTLPLLCALSPDEPVEMAFVPEGCAAAVRVGEVQLPNVENSAAYESFYQLYRGLYPALQGSFRTLATL